MENKLVQAYEREYEIQNDLEDVLRTEFYNIEAFNMLFNAMDKKNKVTEEVGNDYA